MTGSMWLFAIGCVLAALAIGCLRRRRTDKGLAKEAGNGGFLATLDRVFGPLT